MNRNVLEPDSEEAQLLLNRLMLESNLEQSNVGALEKTSDGVAFTTLVPTPGFCVKIKNEKKEKVFINVCVADNVPQPKDLSENDLIKLLESDDQTGFRIPMSIGEPHAEMDKGGAGCTAYDVIIHPSFLKKVQSSKIFQAFFMQITREGIESKYSVELSQEYVILKNRKCVGKLVQQNVRNKSKPFIMEMDEMVGDQLGTSSARDSKNLIEEVSTKPMETKKGPEPKFTIVQEPAEGYPEFLVAEVHLPQVKAANTLSLDVGEDRILLDTRSHVYHLDIYLPYNVVQEEVGSQFHRKNKILTVTMPVQAKT